MTQAPEDLKGARPPLAAIVGPTGAGKTALAVALRGRGLPLEAIGCDALQVYRELDAATAKPDSAQRAALPYHLVDFLPPTERMHAGRYAQLADQAIEAVRGREAWPVLVGGTGLYLRAVVDGLAALPPSPAGLREQLAARWEREGAAAMHAALQRVDPDYAAATPVANRQRVLRALEVHAATGKALSVHFAEQARTPRHDPYIIVLSPPREALVARIEARAEAMAVPLLQECRELLQRGVSADHHAAQAIGYREVLRMIQDGAEDVDAIATLLIKAHKGYAKRQATWFRKVSAQRRVPGLPPWGDDVLEPLAAGLRAHFAPRRDPPRPGGSPVRE